MEPELSINEEETSVEQVAESNQYQQEVLIKLENVHEDLVSIDTSLKYILILLMIVIGVRAAWWISWDLIIKHFQ